MNFNLFLIILIALIIIFLIILYNGLRILLIIEKEKGMVEYIFKVTVLKIPIFKRSDSKEIINIIKDKDEAEDSEESKEEESSESSDEKSKDKKKENFESKDKKSKEDEEENSESEEGDEKSLKEKYEEIKPILIELKKSKEEIKSFLNNILKGIDLKKLEGNLIIGLTDHTTTIKIASWIWSIGAIVNSKKPTLLTVEPRFTEVIVDFEGKIELKINLLILLIYSLVLLSNKNIRGLIKELIDRMK